MTSSSQGVAERIRFSDRDRLPILDGFRGLAVAFVMIYHAKFYGVHAPQAVWWRPYSFGADAGWAGVDLFFVLSGFLITGILYDSRSKGNYFSSFYGRRLCRIFPLYYSMLAVFFILIPFVLRHTHRLELLSQVQPSSQWYAWTYTLNWLIGLKGWAKAPIFLHPFWSLSIEEQFYLCWPLIVRKLKRSALIILCLALIVGSFLFRLILCKTHHAEAAYTFTFCRMDGLAVGALLALCYRSDRDWKILSRIAPKVGIAALAGLIVLIGITGISDFHSLPMIEYGISFFALLFGAIFVFAFNAGPNSAVVRAISSSVFRSIGKYSYCLYCVHQPVILLLSASFVGVRLKHMSGSARTVLAVVCFDAIAFAVAFLIALASWNILEKHFLKLKNLRIFTVQENLQGASGVPSQNWQNLTSPASGSH